MQDPYREIIDNFSGIIDWIFYYWRCLFNLPHSPTPLLPYSQLYNKYSTGFDITSRPQKNQKEIK